jgi:hypothetical protein
MRPCYVEESDVIVGTAVSSASQIMIVVKVERMCYHIGPRGPTGMLQQNGRLWRLHTMDG